MYYAYQVWYVCIYDCIYFHSILLFILSLLLFYPADSQQEGFSLKPGSCSRFLPGKREFFIATVLTSKTIITLLRLCSVRLISSSATLKVRMSWFWWWPSMKHVLHNRSMSLEQKYSSGWWWIMQLLIPRSLRGSTKECDLKASFSWCFWKCLEHSDTSHFRQLFTATDGSSMHWSQKTSVRSGSVWKWPSNCTLAARKPSAMLHSLKFFCRESTSWNGLRHSGQHGGVWSDLSAVQVVIQMQARQ